jgi:hypothetical protein
MMLGPVHEFYYYARLEEDKSSLTGIRSQDFGSDLGPQELVQMTYEDATPQCLVDKIPGLEQPPTGIVGYGAPPAPPVRIQPPQPAIDFDALFEALLTSGCVTSAKLVRFMKDRSLATFQEVMDEAFGKELADSTLRSYANRATRDLRGLESRLWFETREAHIVRRIDPA